jgi:hypothetical protein
MVVLLIEGAIAGGIMPTAPSYGQAPAAVDQPGTDG